MVSYTQEQMEVGCKLERKHKWTGGWRKRWSAYHVGMRLCIFENIKNHKQIVYHVAPTGEITNKEVY